MSSPSPLFTSPGSVYRPPPQRIHTDLADDDSEDEHLVDQSLPSTPLGEKWDDPLHPTPSSSHYVQPERDESETSSKPVSGERADADEDVPEAVSADAEQVEEDKDTRQCRICFGGVGDEAELGRLISPCLCAGSMRYVHVVCINAWRGTGTNAKAFMECPQCHHQYRLRRTLASGLATSRPLLILLSTILFITLAVLLGQVLYAMMLVSPTVTSTVLPSQTTNKGRSGIHASSAYDLFGDDYDYYDDDGGSSFIIIGGGASLVYDIVIGGVQVFAEVASQLSVFAPSFGFGLFVRFMLGLSILGSFSFLSLLLSLSLFAPLQLANGFRGGFFRAFRRHTQQTNGTLGTGQIMILVLVLIGAVRSMLGTYKAVRSLTEKLLSYVETQILEVNPEERRQAREKAREGWVRRWFREERWRLLSGWKEVGVRGWMAGKGGVRNWWDRGRERVREWNEREAVVGEE